MDVLSVIFSILSYLFGFSKPDTTPSIIPPSPTVTVQKTVEFNVTMYAYSMLGPVENVSLYSNLPGKKTSQELKTQYSCTHLVNGGFYTKEDTHIGLFLTEGIVRHEQLNSSLFNAFIAAPKIGNPIIANTLPDTALSFALQSGPQLLDSGEPRKLQLTADETARRIIAGVDSFGHMYFFSIYLPGNSFSGPLLADVPKLLLEILRVEQINLTDAINLDGGNHSVFYGKDDTLHELSPIGSFFCIQ